MARGRHRRRSGLLARLLGPRRQRRADVLRAELARTSALATAAAEAAQAALVRASLAEERAALAEARLWEAVRELTAMRTELTALREDVLWAHAEGRLPVAAPAVIDLRDEAPRTA
jgi:hypothetical protein